jgi:DNA polymerase IV
MPNRLVACVYLDFFLVTIARQLDPALAGVPLLIGGEPQRYGQITEASPEALARGVCPDTPCWQALRCCPEAVLRSEDAQATRAMACRVARLLEGYGPQVERAGRQRFYLDVTGVSPLPMGRAIQGQLRRDLGLTASIGVAANRLMAGIAAVSQGPGGLAWVPAGQEAAFLAPLPISSLPDGVGRPMGPVMRERLARLGIKRIGDLQAMSQGLLVAQFGQEGKRLYALARGLTRDPAWGLEAPPAAESIAFEEVFDRRLGDPAALRRWSIFLSGRVGRQLRQGGQTAGRLTLTLGHPEHPPTVLTARLGRPSDVDQNIAAAMVRALDGCRVPGEGVVSIEVEAGDLRKASEQAVLIPDKDTARETKMRRANQAANAITRAHGERAILLACVLDLEIMSKLS